MCRLPAAARNAAGILALEEAEDLAIPTRTATHGNGEQPDSTERSGMPAPKPPGMPA